MDLGGLATAQFTAALSNIVLAVIGLAVGTVLKAVYAFITARTTVQQRTIVYDIVGAAIHAAEGLGLGGVITDKKAYAEQVASDELKKLGISISPDQLDAIIEAQVYTTFNYGKQPDPTPPPADPGTGTVVDGTSGTPAPIDTTVTP